MLFYGLKTETFKNGLIILGLKMNINVIEQNKNLLKIELVGKTHTIANAVSKELWNDEDVAVAGYTLDHPLVRDYSGLTERTFERVPGTQAPRPFPSQEEYPESAASHPA